MKHRFAWRYTLTGADGTSRAWGDCPRWAAQRLPQGASLTRERVLAVGTPKPCTFYGCRDRHIHLPSPF